MEKNIIRILLLGKTGVGKSSFINYFLGTDVAAAGAGKPCTQILTKYEFSEWDNCTIELYDSKGLEVKDADNWTRDILSELESSSEREFQDRYHTIFYCISAQKKIEEYEKKTLRELQQAAKQSIHIILTHCDSIDDATLEERENYLKQNISDTIAVYRVTSVNKVARDGTGAKKYGREAVLDGVFDLLWQNVAESIAHKVAHEYSIRYLDELRALRRYTNNFIAEHGGFFKGLFRDWEEDREMNNTAQKIMDAIDDMSDDILYEMKDDINSYVESLGEIYNAYTQISPDIKKIDAKDIYESCVTEAFSWKLIKAQFQSMDLQFMRLRLTGKSETQKSIDDMFENLADGINEDAIRKSIFKKLIERGENNGKNN